MQPARQLGSEVSLLLRNNPDYIRFLLLLSQLAGLSQICKRLRVKHMLVGAQTSSGLGSVDSDGGV